MSVDLRLVLDQLVTPTDPDLARVSGELAGALIDTAPQGCGVDALLPAGDEIAVAGLGNQQRMTLRRRELAAAWAAGVTAGSGGGLIHSPTLLAPLARHDRVNDHDQVVVSVWDESAWRREPGARRFVPGWSEVMLRRAERYADAVVVPSHALAERLSERTRLGNRLRVIPGAAPTGCAVSAGAASLRRAEGVPDRYLVSAGSAAPEDSLIDAFRAAAVAGLPLVVLDVPEGDEAPLRELAALAGLAPNDLVLLARRGGATRFAILAAAEAFIRAANDAGWPWRAIEALALGTPVVAVDTPLHREVIVDGGLLVPAEQLGDGVGQAIGAQRGRLSVLAKDRARAFSWAGAAEKVWQLHAEL